MRTLLSLLLLLFALPVLACSCTGEHYALEDYLCTIDTSEGFVVELVFEREDAEQYLHFRVGEVFRGDYPEARLVMTEYANSCFNPLLLEPSAGDRYVYFGYRYRGDTGYGAYECGHNADLFRLRTDDQSFQYPFTNPGSNFNAGLRYRPVADLRATYCRDGNGAAELADARLAGNDGRGLLRLLGAGQTPVVTDNIAVYDAAGRKVTVAALPGAGALSLTGLPAGVYYVVARRRGERRVWPVLIR